MAESNHPERASSASNWPALQRFIAFEQQIAAWAMQERMTGFLYEFLRFGVKQAWACLFGGVMVALLIVTYAFYPRSAWLPRYDFLCLAALAVQVLMLRFRLESLDEAKVIFIYHLVGTAMEVFKTAAGSWVYPEASYLRLGGVPLFTGFMYAAIGSYIARAWRLFDFRFAHYPPLWTTWLLAIAIYLNFFTHHYIWDARLVLFLAYALLFGRCWIFYRVHTSWRRMPVLLATLLVALFIWLAENIGTFTRTWLYPNQKSGWEMVTFSKLGSWYLLMIISVVLVTAVNRPKEMG